MGPAGDRTDLHVARPPDPLDESDSTTCCAGCKGKAAPHLRLAGQRNRGQPPSLDRRLTRLGSERWQRPAGVGDRARSSRRTRSGRTRARTVAEAGAEPARVSVRASPGKEPVETTGRISRPTRGGTRRPPPRATGRQGRAAGGRAVRSAGLDTAGRPGRPTRIGARSAETNPKRLPRSVRVSAQPFPEGRARRHQHNRGRHGRGPVSRPVQRFEDGRRAPWRARDASRRARPDLLRPAGRMVPRPGSPCRGRADDAPGRSWRGRAGT